MPLSPLIRPLSPLQTQSAPSLPAPYNVADAVLGTHADAVLDRGNCPHATLPAPGLSHNSNNGGGSTQHNRPAALLLSSHAHIAAPTFHELVTKSSGEVDVKPRSRSTAFPHPQAPPLSGARASSSAAIQLSLSQSPAAGLEEPQREATWRGNHARHSHDLFLSRSPKTLFPTSLISANASPAIKTATTAVAPADAAPGNLGAGHPYRSNQRPNAPQRESYATGDSDGAGGASHSSGAYPPLSSPPPPPTNLAAAAVPATSLLHASTTSIAVAASWPSYGAALLQNASPGKGTRNFRRRCPSPPPTAAVHFEADALASSAPLSKAFIGEAPQGAPTTNKRTTTGALAAVGPTRDEDEMFALGSAAASAADAPPNLYRGTAVSTRTGRRYNISIEALLDTGSARATSLPSGERKGDSSTSSADVETFGAKDEEDGASAETVPTYEYSQGCASVRSAPAQATQARKDRKLEKLRNHHKALRPPLPSAGSPSSSCGSSQPVLGDTVTLPSPPAALSLSSYPRYAYPALNECRRLLQEIETQNPLLRRCLTPPRPLLDGDSALIEKAELTRVDAATAAAGVGEPGAAVGYNGNPTSVSKALHPDSSALADPPMNAKAHLGGLVPAQDARRLYHWDARTGIEDPSFMHGPFQLSAERFSRSTARQLQRLRETGKRLYGARGGTQQASIASVVGAPCLSGDSFLISKSGASHVCGTGARCREVFNPLDGEGGGPELPSGRLHRLLRETEAAFPILWRATHRPTASSPTESEIWEHSMPDSGWGAFNMPSPSTICPLPEEKDRSSNFTLSRLNDPPPLSSDEAPLRFTVATLTPARPPPPPAHRADISVAVPRRSNE
ncbi:hypothetical protein ABL78_2308 [Leptomonas seymouri]|uniref:Uncharacterized protein n=1 Tax=Leptomonas seymouri TaxID=5684 RepID=A0A0N1PFC9_LEPSE|nr:hypothetical protein ABL78_2308 [Leptomonas seymouri]|eukprot:KPI88575.1 hypothetical protein ABL78_2308 [Leptomonas seymouri]